MSDPVMAKKTRIKRHDFEPLNNVLQKALRQYRQEFDPDLALVWDIWDDIVGANVAENSRPAAFNGRVLLVHVTSSPWLHHMRFIKQDMIFSINKAFGKRLIDARRGEVKQASVFARERLAQCFHCWFAVLLERRESDSMNGRAKSAQW